MPVFERMSGHHVAERVRVPDGSDEAKRLAESPEWRAVDAPKPVKKASPKKPAAKKSTD